jgi:hypothetical protein
LQGFYCHPDVEEELLIRETQDLGANLESSRRFRKGQPELSERFIDITYHELVADPIAVVRRLYQQLGRLTNSVLYRVQRKVLLWAQRRKRSSGATAVDLHPYKVLQIQDFEAYRSRLAGTDATAVRS